MTDEPRGTGSARDFMPPTNQLPVLRDAARQCQGCGLYAFATQAVFGEGPANAPGSAPKIVVCLGSTAAQGLLGKDFRVTRQRGEFVASETGPLLTTIVHPSSILRAADAAARDREMGAFVRDLERIAERLESLG